MVNISVLIAFNKKKKAFQEQDTIQVYKPSMHGSIKHHHHTKPDIPDSFSIDWTVMASATRSQMSSNSGGNCTSGNIKPQQQKY